MGTINYIELKCELFLVPNTQGMEKKVENLFESLSTLRRGHSPTTNPIARPTFIIAPRWIQHNRFFDDVTQGLVYI